MQWGGCGACSGVSVVHAVGWVWCMQWGGSGGAYSGVGVVHAVSNTRMSVVGVVHAQARCSEREGNISDKHSQCSYFIH